MTEKLIEKLEEIKEINKVIIDLDNSIYESVFTTLGGSPYSTDLTGSKRLEDEEEYSKITKNNANILIKINEDIVDTNRLIDEIKEELSIIKSSNNLEEYEKIIQKLSNNQEYIYLLQKHTEMEEYIEFFYKDGIIPLRKVIDSLKVENKIKETQEITEEIAKEPGQYLANIFSNVSSNIELSNLTNIMKEAYNVTNSETIGWFIALNESNPDIFKAILQNRFITGEERYLLLIEEINNKSAILNDDMKGWYQPFDSSGIVEQQSGGVVDISLFDVKGNTYSIAAQHLTNATTSKEGTQLTRHTYQQSLLSKLVTIEDINNIKTEVGINNQIENIDTLFEDKENRELNITNELRNEYLSNLKNKILGNVNKEEYIKIKDKYFEKSIAKTTKNMQDDFIKILKERINIIDKMEKELIEKFSIRKEIFGNKKATYFEDIGISEEYFIEILNELFGQSKMVLLQTLNSNSLKTKNKYNMLGMPNNYDEEQDKNVMETMMWLSAYSLGNENESVFSAYLHKKLLENTDVIKSLSLIGKDGIQIKSANITLDDIEYFKTILKTKNLKELSQEELKEIIENENSLVLKAFISYFNKAPELSSKIIKDILNNSINVLYTKSELTYENTNPTEAKLIEDNILLLQVVLYALEEKVEVIFVKEDLKNANEELKDKSDIIKDKSDIIKDQDGVIKDQDGVIKDQDEMIIKDYIKNLNKYKDQDFLISILNLYKTQKKNNYLLKEIILENSIDDFVTNIKEIINKLINDNDNDLSKILKNSIELLIEIIAENQSQENIDTIINFSTDIITSILESGITPNLKKELTGYLITSSLGKLSKKIANQAISDIIKEIKKEYLNKIKSHKSINNYIKQKEEKIGISKPKSDN